MSNICDGGYLGIKRTLALFGPRLRSREDNPHATLVTLFLNAVQEVTSKMDEYQEMFKEMKKVSAYLPQTAPPSSNDAGFLWASAAVCMVRDVDKFFNKCVST